MNILESNYIHLTLKNELRTIKYKLINTIIISE